MVKNEAVDVALALNPEGEKEVLGLWIEQTEGAKFWLKVINDLKARGRLRPPPAAAAALTELAARLLATMGSMTMSGLCKKRLKFNLHRGLKAVLPPPMPGYKKSSRPLLTYNANVLSGTFEDR
jgi:hypothetical protein